MKRDRSADSGVPLPHLVDQTRLGDPHSLYSMVPGKTIRQIFFFFLWGSGQISMIALGFNWKYSKLKELLWEWDSD